MDLRRAVPVLTVADVGAAVEEYAAVLGLDVLMDLGWVVALGSGDGTQFLLMDRDRTAPCNPTMSLEVPDVDAAHEQARAGGADIVHPLQDEQWGVRRFFVRTRDGHVVNVLSHRD